MAGLEKPKRKRGRPPKPAPEVLKAQELAAAEVSLFIFRVKLAKL